jgi:transcriptional regulator with GAF, ATPase, and Fis domain
MELELVNGRPAEALRRYAAVAGRSIYAPGLPDWRRLHALAIQAHERLMTPDPIEPPAVATEDAASQPAAGGLVITVASSPSRIALPHRLAQDPTASSGAGAAERPPDHAPAARIDPADWEASATEGRPQEESAALQRSSQTEILSWLQRIQELLEVAEDEEALAAELASLAGRILGGRGLVILFEGSRPQVIRGDRMLEPDADDISRTVIERVRESRATFVCPDIRIDPELGQLRSLRSAGVSSVLCSPIIRANTCLGVVYVDHREPGRLSGDGAVQVLTRIAALSGECLEALSRRPRALKLEPDAFGLIGNSAPMRQLKAQLAMLGETRTPDLVVLLLGETGTGKSMIAQAIHEHGARRSGPFIPVNCASIPHSLFEELMFGHERGTFTGANASRPGWFELAEKGTLFLDEIGDMPREQQTGLLTTLSSRRVRRLGGSREHRIDSHLIFATNHDLEEAARAGRFREDLLRRIHVNVCRVPPLRERGWEDISLLARHMIRRDLIAQKCLPADAPLVSMRDCFTRKAEDFLYRYPWPWNVGEMENLFRNEGIRRILRSMGRQRIDVPHLEELLSRRAPPSSAAGSIASATGLPVEGLSYPGVNAWCEELKAKYVRGVYRECGENVRQAALRLGCSRDIVYKYLKAGSQGDAAGEGRSTPEATVADVARS